MCFHWLCFTIKLLILLQGCTRAIAEWHREEINQIDLEFVDESEKHVTETTAHVFNQNYPQTSDTLFL